MKKEKIQYANCTLHIECPEGHKFLSDLDCLEHYPNIYKGEDMGESVEILCERCNKNYRL